MVFEREPVMPAVVETLRVLLEGVLQIARTDERIEETSAHKNSPDSTTREGREGPALT